MMFITLRASAVFTCLAAASLLIVFLGTPVNATGTFMSPEVELAEAVAYGKLRPFAPDEERLDCVRAAAKLAKEMNEVSRNAAKAQVIYDRDPDSQAGIAAEQSIELMDSLASRLGKQLHDTTVECAKRVNIYIYRLGSGAGFARALAYGIISRYHIKKEQNKNKKK